VEVHCSEGVAIRADLESCGVIREDGGEALTEESTGQPLSRERLIPDADTVTYVEGNTQRRASASAVCDPAWSETLACAEVSCTGTGRSWGWPGSITGPHREGKEP
jgi:hypothetical protein